MLNVKTLQGLIKHPNAGLGVFAAMSFGKIIYVGYIYGFVLYADLRLCHNRTFKHLEQIIEATMEPFSEVDKPTSWGGS